MEILKHRNDIRLIAQYKCVCKCGCEFICFHSELSRIEKCPNGKVWAKCPECGAEMEPCSQWLEKIDSNDFADSSSEEESTIMNNINANRAQKYLDEKRNFETSNKATQVMLDNCFKYAYCLGCNDMINKTKEWFTTKGPFVFPEDDEVLEDMLNYLKYNEGN